MERKRDEAVSRSTLKIDAVKKVTVTYVEPCEGWVSCVEALQWYIAMLKHLQESRLKGGRSLRLRRGDALCGERLEGDGRWWVSRGGLVTKWRVWGNIGKDLLKMRFPRNRGMYIEVPQQR